jgi:hypothetical protein
MLQQRLDNPPWISLQAKLATACHLRLQYATGSPHGKPHFSSMSGIHISEMGGYIDLFQSYNGSKLPSGDPNLVRSTATASAQEIDLAIRPAEFLLLCWCASNAARSPVWVSWFSMKQRMHSRSLSYLTLQDSVGETAISSTPFISLTTRAPCDRGIVTRGKR